MKLSLILLFVSSCCYAQTVTTADKTVTTSAPVTNSLSASCTIPKNGGTCKFSFPPQTLAPLTAKIPGQTVPVVSGPLTYAFTCSGPDMQHLTCTATVAK